MKYSLLAILLISAISCEVILEGINEEKYIITKNQLSILCVDDCKICKDLPTKSKDNTCSINYTKIDLVGLDISQEKIQLNLKIASHKNINSNMIYLRLFLKNHNILKFINFVNKVGFKSEYSVTIKENNGALIYNDGKMVFRGDSEDIEVFKGEFDYCDDSGRLTCRFPVKDNSKISVGIKRLGHKEYQAQMYFTTSKFEAAFKWDFSSKKLLTYFKYIHKVMGDMLELRLPEDDGLVFLS
jgi:hypothetical protein